MRKAGDIIPEVVAVKSHAPGSVPYEMPKVCPSCGAKVFREEDEAVIRCTNAACPAQLARHLIHFASLRSEFFTGETYKAKIMEYDPAVDHLAISMKEVEPHPYDGVEIRHPINSRRASKVTAKFGGNVFCRLDGNLDCLCTYSSQWSDSDFSIGDRVVIAISKFNPVKKQVFGKVIAKL